MYENDNSSSEDNEIRVLDFNTQVDLQQRNLLKMIHLIYLNNQCWHSTLENESGSPLQPPSPVMLPCKGACPYCLGKTGDYIMPVSRLGVSKFLAHIFINMSGVDLSPLNVVKLLHDFDDVGKIVYKRQRSSNAPETKYLQSTVLQLIGSGIIVLKMTIDEPDPVCCLSINELDSSPCYLDSSYWKDFILI